MKPWVLDTGCDVDLGKEKQKRKHLRCPPSEKKEKDWERETRRGLHRYIGIEGRDQRERERNCSRLLGREWNVLLSILRMGVGGTGQRVQ